MNLISIAERVERYAPSGNFGVDRDKERELNELIAVATGKPLTVKVGDSALGNERLVPNQLPNFVASLDAAMSLVPEGSLFTTRTLWAGDNVCGFASVSRYEDAKFGGHFRRYWVDEHQTNAATAPLALTAAALRALASEQPA